MRKWIYCVLLLLITSFVVGCSKQGLSEASVDINDPNYQAGVEIALRRAKQITDVIWTPLSAIPKTRPEGSFFQPGKTYKGIPYSSVKEMSKFVGQDVSIHTFLSAVTNPRSVLYTEVVNDAPYHGTNCSSYYGIVCSMSVNYALGIDAPYPSRSYASAPFMEKVTDLDVDLIRTGDVLASKGHTIMAVDVRRDASGMVMEALFLENSYYISFSREELIDYWLSGKYVLYRYKGMENDKEIPEIEPVVESPSLCPNRGDKSVYRSDEQVVLNILADGYQSMAIYREESLMKESPIYNQDIILENLPEGMYSAQLIGEGKESEYTFFEIRDAIIRIEQKHNKIQLSFGENSIPASSVELCDISGDHLFTKALSDDEKAKKTVQLDYLSRSDPYYCKVIFQGNYGKIPSKYIEIKR